MKALKEWAISFLIGVPLAFLVQTFVAEPVHVDGSSMEPTLSNKDVVLVEKLSYRLHPPAVGDVVIVKQGGMLLIKRVEAAGGDKIKVQGGEVWRNGEKIDERFDKIAKDFPETEVPKGKIFVMGDNRNNSADSRYFGPFSEADVEGKAIFEVYANFGKKL